MQQIDAAERLMEVLDGFFKGVQGDRWLLIGKTACTKQTAVRSCAAKCWRHG